MKKILTAALILLALVARAPRAAADIYVKQGSAPANPQITTRLDPQGSPVLDAIVGTLTSTLTGDERATRFDTPIPDIFQIYLTGGGSFSATTANIETQFDTRLYLFDANWRGVVYNDDDIHFFGGYSTLPVGSVLIPGFYYLAVAPWGLIPQSASGPIFPDIFTSAAYTFTDVAGPTGAGGAARLNRWTGAADTVETGPYRIALTGAVFATAASVPEPGTVALTIGVVGPAALLWRRRRRPAILPFLLLFALPLCSAVPARAQGEVNTIRGIKTIASPSGVEIEVHSTREFGVRNDIAILSVGAQQITLSRPPADGSLNTLIFFLSPAQWAKTNTGDRVFVTYGSDDPKDTRERWDFGSLDKSRLDK